MLHAFNWTEDESELIDFDNSSFNENKLEIGDSCKIYRIEDDIKLDYSHNYDNSSEQLKLSEYEDSIKMGEIKYKKNKYYFIPNIQEGIEDLNGEKAFSWFVFKGEKYPKTKNRYKIKEGDIFKLARIFFIVRGIHLKKKKIDENNTNCLISYHSKINQSLVINDNCKNENEIIDNSSESSNTDICVDSDESEEEEKNDKILKLKQNTKNKESKPKSKSKKNKKNKKDDKAIINELKSVNNVNIIQKEKHDHLNTDESKKSEKQKICRICYIGETESNSNPLIKPCKCSGSMKYIHFKCLLHWLKTKIKIDKSEYIENEYFSLYSPENVQCELCKEYFPHFLKHNNKLFNLTELEQNYESDLKEDNKKNEPTDKNNENINLNDNYLVLDSMSPDKEIIPYRYIVKFSKNNILKIGRGLDMNLILNDLSVSRNHCQFELNDNGEIFLKDNNSKFGTLILVQAKSLEILKGQMLTIQTGRTYFNINYKTNFSLFSCCNPEEIDLRTTYAKMNFKYVKVEKNSVVLTESDSDEEYGDENGKKLIDEDKKEENEYENNIKKLNNKKIKLVKIVKKDSKKQENINLNIKDERNITEQKKERRNSKKISNLNKSLDDKDNIEDDDNNKENKKKNNNKKEEKSNEKNNENKKKEDKH